MGAASRSGVVLPFMAGTLALEPDYGGGALFWERSFSFRNPEGVVQA